MGKLRFGNEHPQTLNPKPLHFKTKNPKPWRGGSRAFGTIEVWASSVEGSRAVVSDLWAQVLWLMPEIRVLGVGS